MWNEWWWQLSEDRIEYLVGKLWKHHRMDRWVVLALLYYNTMYWYLTVSISKRISVAISMPWPIVHYRESMEYYQPLSYENESLTADTRHKTRRAIVIVNTPAWQLPLPNQFSPYPHAHARMLPCSMDIGSHLTASSLHICRSRNPEKKREFRLALQSVERVNG